MTYAEARDLFIRQQQSAQTQRAYTADLARWFNFLQQVWPPTAEQAVSFREALEAQLAPASAARVFNTVRTFHRFCVAQDTLQRNPFDGIKPVKRLTNQTPKVPSDVDVAKLVDSAGSPRRKAVIALLLNGLRAGEVSGLTTDDYRYEPDYGHYLRVVGKGMKERFVPLLPEANAALLLFHNAKAAQQKLSPWLVSDHDGSQLTVRQVEHDVYKAAEHAGIEGMHAHALRHHYATRLIRAGASVLHVAKLLGHSRADTTQVYVTLDLSDLVGAAKRDPRYQPTEDALRLTAVG